MTDEPQWVNVEDLKSLITHDRAATANTAETVDKYARLSTTSPAPAIVVSYYDDRGDLLIHDGNHRVAACRKRLESARQMCRTEKAKKTKKAYLSVLTPFRPGGPMGSGGCKLPKNEEDRASAQASRGSKRIFPSDIGMDVVRRRDGNDDEGLFDSDGELRDVDDTNIVWC